MNYQASVASLPTMPTRRAMWLSFLQWVVLPPTVILTSGVVPGLLDTSISVYSSPGTIVAVVGVVVYWILVSFMIKEGTTQLKSGETERERMEGISSMPFALLFVKNSSVWWNENAQRIMQEDAQKQDQETREHRVQELLSAVPDKIEDLRGQTLRQVLQNILATLDVFERDLYAPEVLSFTQGFLPYNKVIEAIACQLAEDAGRVWVSIPRLADGTRPKKLEAFMEEFGVYMDVGGIYVRAQRDVPSALRRAIAYILNEK